MEAHAATSFSDIDTNIAFLDEGRGKLAAESGYGRSGNLKVGQDVLAAF